MDTVENPRTAVWCDHVIAYGMFAASERRSVVVKSAPVHVVVEEGKVKLLCTACYMKAIQLPIVI